jgi:hypothetical protein
MSSVVDYVGKVCLACPVTATKTWRDAVAALEDARTAAHDLLGRPLLDDVTDPQTGEVVPVIVVTDNGAAYRAAGFARYIASRAPSCATSAPGSRAPKPTASSSASSARSRSSSFGASCPTTARA